MGREKKKGARGVERNLPTGENVKKKRRVGAPFHFFYCLSLQIDANYIQADEHNKFEVYERGGGCEEILIKNGERISSEALISAGQLQRSRQELFLTRRSPIYSAPPKLMRPVDAAAAAARQQSRNLFPTPQTRVWSFNGRQSEENAAEIKRSTP